MTKMKKILAILIVLFVKSTLIKCQEQERTIHYDIIQPTASEYMIVKKDVSKCDLEQKNFRKRIYKNELLREVRTYSIKGELSSFGYDNAIVRFDYYEDGKIKQISLFNKYDEPDVDYIREFFMIKYYYERDYYVRIEYLNQDYELINSGVNDFPSIEEYYEIENGYLRKFLDENNDLLSEKKVDDLPCIPYLTCERIEL